MSKESAIRFLILKDKDEAIKSAIDAIMVQVDAEEPSWGKAIQEEVIPLAKKYGYDLSPEDFKAPKKQHLKGLRTKSWIWWRVAAGRSTNT